MTKSIEEFEEILNEFEGDKKFRKLEKLLASANKWATEREEGVDEVMMDFGQDGGLFFLTNNESLASDVNIHRAFMTATEELWMDDDIVRDYHDEVTAETVAETLARQIEEFGIAWDFSETMKESFVRKVGESE